MKEKLKDKISFEASLQKLEDIVNKLEEGSTPLEESLKLFEEGVKCSRFCSSKLEETKRKIEVLIKKDGEIKPEPYHEQ
ncbi:MAG: exodeoxyribonuclease VII small subunit [bacterium]